MPKQRTWWFIVGFAPLMVLGCSEASPAPTPTPTPTGPSVVTFVQRSLKLEQTRDVDLDTGTIAPRIETDADVWFEAVKAPERYLTPEFGSRIAFMGTTAPGFATCNTTPISGNRIPMDALVAGTYVCVLTNKYHVAEIRIDEAAAPYVPGSGVAPTLGMTVTLYQ